MGENEQPDNEFKVFDKRKLTTEGEIREPDVNTAEEKTPHPSAEDAETFPPASFSLLVLQLATSATIFLGEIALPSTGEKEVNLAGARHYIDLLGILAEKTSGKLDREEERLLNSILTDLRLKYVEKHKSGSTIQ